MRTPVQVINIRTRSLHSFEGFLFKNRTPHEKQEKCGDQTRFSFALSRKIFSTIREQMLSPKCNVVYPYRIVVLTSLSVND
jgi:hypothetical protein